MIDSQKVKGSAADIKELSNGAEQVITELYGKQRQFQIEEVSKADKKWIITVSFFREHESPNDLQKFLGVFGNRVYKQLTLESDGTVVSIKNWFPEPAAIS